MKYKTASIDQVPVIIECEDDAFIITYEALIKLFEELEEDEQRHLPDHKNCHDC